MPALFTKMSTRPSFSSAAVASASVSVWLETSHICPTALRPKSAAICSAACSASARFRLTTITSAPALAKPAAIACPSPFEPPVMTAVFPLKSNCLIPGNIFLLNSLLQIKPMDPSKDRVLGHEQIAGLIKCHAVRRGKIAGTPLGRR